MQRPVVVLLALAFAACEFPQLSFTHDAHTGGDGSSNGGDGGSGADAPPVIPSCVGLAMTCGPNASSSCCGTSLVPGNATGATMAGAEYFRSYDVAGDADSGNTAYPATVSDFKLDTYEVTVGRFRAFVNAGMGTSANPPAPGAGAHAKIPASGWDASFDSSLTGSAAALSTALACSTTVSATWTAEPGANEDLPLTCVTWFEAFAFCIWDGGYLPTETEWNYAASGGSDQRAYPWSSPPSSVAIGCMNANYDNDGSAGYCVNGTVGATERVGSASPAGDGKFGQADLGGNVVEWTLDWYASPYSSPCNDCANLIAATGRVTRGAAWDYGPIELRTGLRFFEAPANRDTITGFRCARAP
jgi:formylglycine-generating enzyme required for sulfatase activity